MQDLLGTSLVVRGSFGAPLGTQIGILGPVGSTFGKMLIYLRMLNHVGGNFGVMLGQFGVILASFWYQKGFQN